MLNCGVFSSYWNSRNIKDFLVVTDSVFHVCTVQPLEHLIAECNWSICCVGMLMRKFDDCLKASDVTVWLKLQQQDIKPQYYAFRWLTLLLSQEFELPGMTTNSQVCRLLNTDILLHCIDNFQHQWMPHICDNHCWVLFNSWFFSVFPTVCVHLY